MKKTFLILGITAIFAALPAFAELTVADTTSEEYLNNHGYSANLIRATQKSAAQANGVECPEKIENENYNKPVVKAVRRFFMYLDPAYDSHTFMNNHDIKGYSSFEDL